VLQTVLFKILTKYFSVMFTYLPYKVIQEENLIFWEVMESVIVRKKFI